MVFVDMGGGKTLLTLALIKYRKQCGPAGKAIVFVPYITSVATWVDECLKHTPELKCVPLVGSSIENRSALEGPGDLFVICYQSAVAMVTEKAQGKWKLTAADVRDYFQGFDMLVMDEIHRTKNIQSLAYRMCRAISAQCDWALGLTGTPFGRDLADLWPQFYLIDFGETLGPTMGFYREVFFKQKAGFWGGRDYTFKKRLMPDLKRIIKHRSIRYGIGEFFDMPPKVSVIREIQTPADSQGYCESAIQAIEASLKSGNVQYSIIESNYLQLRQLSSAFMTLKGEDSSKLHVKFDENHKLDALQAELEAVPYGHKVVIFHHFIHSSGVISERLKAMGIRHARIWSGQKDPIGELRKFQTDPECTVMVLNWRSGSSSLNLQNASYLMVYEQPDSPIDRTQGEARLWRPGQKHRVFIIDFLVRGTWDKRMYLSNKAGRSLLEELLSGQKLKLKEAKRGVA